MRKKNQATKILKDYKPLGQHMLAMYGEHWAFKREAIDFAEDWKSFFQWSKNPHYSDHGYEKKGRVSKKHLKESERELTLNLVGKVKQAVLSGDGKFFADLATAVKIINEPINDPLRAWLINYFALKLGPKFYGTAIPITTGILFKTLRADYAKRFKDGIDDRQLRHTVKELGYLLEPDAERAPRGPRIK